MKQEYESHILYILLRFNAPRILFKGFVVCNLFRAAAMSILLSNILAKFNKSYFDFESPDIGLSDFHPQIRIILALNGLFFNNKSSKLRFIWPFICTALSITATTLELMALGHALKENDFALLTQCFAYAVIIAVVPFLYLCIFKNSKKISDLVDHMDSDFRFICGIGDPFRSIFLNGQLTIWKCGFVWMTFVIFVACCYILLAVVALIYHCLFVTHDENSTRPLIFPIWLPNDDPYRTPVYECLLCTMFFIIIDFVTTFTAYVYIVFHLLLHCFFLMDLIVLSMEKLFDGIYPSVAYVQDERYWGAKKILSTRIKTIVDWHNGVFTLVNNTLDVFGTVLAYQVIFSSMVMCLMAFYISVQIEQGSFDFCVSLLAVGALVQLWIPCYLGSLLRTKGYQIGDACFNTGWHNSPLGSMVKRDLQIIIMRSQRPITIQVTCLPLLQLETFSSILSTAYSYFNMLRQTGE